LELDTFLAEDHDGVNFRREVREFSLDNLQVGFDERVNNNHECVGKEEEPTKMEGKMKSGDLKSWL
jgi:hypothetical protein